MKLAGKLSWIVSQADVRKKILKEWKSLICILCDEEGENSLVIYEWKNGWEVVYLQA